MSQFNPGYVSEAELRDEGFRAVGKDVFIARNCTIIGCENIEIGSNVRIDGYTTIIAAEGNVHIGSNIHIGAYCLLSGGDDIELQDFSGLSQGVKIYSRTDDYSGDHLTNPTVPSRFTGGKCGKVTLARHVIIGAASVILPDLSIGEGSSIGALSLVTKDLEEWGIYAGRPARRIRSRSKKLLELEREFLAEIESSK